MAPRLPNTQAGGVREEDCAYSLRIDWFALARIQVRQPSLRPHFPLVNLPPLGEAQQEAFDDG
ncbi:hypothetical protein N7527_010363 [Penicillium freii]|nr:hypothetical protein N7527_010363 [Penicillium freii]